MDTALELDDGLGDAVVGLDLDEDLKSSLNALDMVDAFWTEAVSAK